MNLIKKLEKRSSELLLTKLLSMSLYKIQEDKRLRALAWEMVHLGEYDMADYFRFLKANGIKEF